MLSIEKAKEQADILEKYLLTVGKNLKHTHALEAVARMHGHKSWNTFQANPLEGAELSVTGLTGKDLANMFANGDVSHVTLDGLRYEIRYYDSERLGSFEEIVSGSDEDFQLEDTCVEIERVEDSRAWEEFLSIENLNKATHNAGTWSLPGIGELCLFKSEQVLVPFAN